MYDGSGMRILVPPGRFATAGLDIVSEGGEVGEPGDPGMEMDKFLVMTEEIR